MDEADEMSNRTADGSTNGTLFGWLTQDVVDGFDDVFAYSKNDTLVSLYSNWPYCSAPQVNASAAAGGNASGGVDADKMPLPVFELATSLFLLVVVAIPGLLGNFISIFILSRPQMRSSLNVILIGETLLLFHFRCPISSSKRQVDRYFHKSFIRSVVARFIK